MPFRVLCLVACLVLTAPLVSAEDDAAADLTTAFKTADAIRTKLPMPLPNKALRFEGDIVINKVWAGEVKYTAQATKFARKAVWQVTEEVYIDFGGVETRVKGKFHLAQDLSLMWGNLERLREGRGASLVFARSATGFRVLRTEKTEAGSGETKTFDVAAQKNATFGRVAQLLFLRAVPESAKKTFALPTVAFDALATAAPKKASIPEADPTVLETKGKGRYDAAGKAQPSWVTATRRGKVEFDVHLAPKTRTLIGVVAKTTSAHIVPKGAAGERVTLDEEKPSKTWQQAFLKFGYGYHMAREKLLAEAFHWETMHEYESTVAKSWPAERSVEEFKQAWIKEFVAQSLHRPRSDTERLLSMTLATGKPQKKGDDKVIFAAHANFGGGTQRTYHLQRIEGLWYIVRVDF